MRQRKRSILNHVAGGIGSFREMPQGQFTTRKHGALKSDGITTVGVGVERYPVGVGNVVIPSNVERDKYLLTCMRAGKVGLFIDGNFVWDVPIDQRVLQNIEFPRRYGDLGSLVVFVNIPKHNTPIVIGVISKDDEVSDLEEDLKKVGKRTSYAAAETIYSGKGALTTIVTSDDPRTTPRVNSLIGSRDVPAEISHRIWGQVLEYIVGDKTEAATNSMTWIVDGDPARDDVDRFLMTYYAGVGFSFQDEWLNTIKTEEDKMTIDAPEILHGVNATEPAVLGDTLESIMSDFLDAVLALTVTTANGPSGTPINFAQFQAVKARLTEFKSTKNKIE